MQNIFFPLRRDRRADDINELGLTESFEASILDLVPTGQDQVSDPAEETERELDDSIDFATSDCTACRRRAKTRHHHLKNLQDDAHGAHFDTLYQASKQRSENKFRPHPRVKLREHYERTHRYMREDGYRESLRASTLRQRRDRKMKEARGLVHPPTASGRFRTAEELRMQHFHTRNRPRGEPFDEDRPRKHRFSRTAGPSTREDDDFDFDNL